MIDHKGLCIGDPCTCNLAERTKAWDDTGWALSNPSIGEPVACNCIHIDGVWMTRHSEQCVVHPCTACTMRAGKHIAHIHIEGLSLLDDGDVHMRNCWACGKQQYLNRNHEWTHVYPAEGCLHDEDTRERTA